MSIIKIALTGGIASGKTEVSKILADLGIDIIDMDILAKEVVKPNSRALKELVLEFGKDILAKDGNLKRDKLKSILFNNKDAKNKIEKIIHPRIISAMNSKIKQLKKELVIVVVPLLIEKNLSYLFDKVIVVLCDLDTQIARLIRRDNVTKKAAEKILSQQANNSQRFDLLKKMPSFLINNNKDIKHLKDDVAMLYKKLRLLKNI